MDFGPLWGWLLFIGIGSAFLAPAFLWPLLLWHGAKKARARDARIAAFAVRKRMREEALLRDHPEWNY